MDQPLLMKNSILLGLLFPVFAAGQDCKLIRETDPYTKQTKISTGFIQLEEASVTIDADSREIDLFFSLDGRDKCFDNNSIAAVFFEGTKVKMSYRNSGTMNCQGFFHFTFKNTAAISSLLQKLSTQKTTHIIFTGNNKTETKVELMPDQQHAFMNLASCLLNEAKTLIK